MPERAAEILPISAGELLAFLVHLLVNEALVHWRSADSIRIYGRMDEIYQMNARERASTATFTVINASSLPQIDPVRYTAQGALLMPDLVNIVPRISAAA